MQSGTDVDYTDGPASVGLEVASDLLLADGGSTRSSCVCHRQQETTTPDDTTCCSQSYDCLPVSGNGAAITSSSCSSMSTNSQSSGRSQQPFFLHPPRNPIRTEEIQPKKESFFLNPLKTSVHLENHRNQMNGHEPFYLHDPKAVVYTRVRELFLPASATDSATSACDTDVFTSENASHPSSSESESDSTSSMSNDDNNNVTNGPTDSQVSVANFSKKCLCCHSLRVK